MPVRVYELAHEFDLETKVVLEACRKEGLDVKSHSSTIEEYEADMVRRRLSGLAEADDGEEEAAAPAAPPAPVKPPPPPAEPGAPPTDAQGASVEGAPKPPDA